MNGTQELFAREDGVEASWRIVEPILGDKVPLQWYEPGTWGPPEARRLIGRDGPWIDPVLEATPEGGTGEGPGRARPGSRRGVQPRKG